MRDEPFSLRLCRWPLKLYPAGTDFGFGPTVIGTLDSPLLLGRDGSGAVPAPVPAEILRD